MSGRKISVLIADDHSIVRMGLATLLEIENDMILVGQAVNGQTAVEEALRLKPDVVVMDLMMPVLNGADATAQITAKLPETKVVLFTTFPTSDMIAKAIENGAAGAIFKSAADTELVKAIRAVADGRTYISPDVAKLQASDPPVEPLTPRQKDILKSLVRGLSNNDIAKELGITATAVREHTIALFHKLRAANRTEATAIALRKHLLPNE
jgi:DNA-binding NarL/FixJ family response regulator